MTADYSHIYKTTYSSWDSGRRPSGSSRHRACFSRGRRYELTVGEIFCSSEKDNLRAVSQGSAFGIFYKILDWNGDLLITEIVATAFNGMRRVNEAAHFRYDKIGTYDCLEPSLDPKARYYFFFAKDLVQLEKEHRITVPHLNRIGIDRNSDLIGRFFFNPKNEYDMVDQMSLEECLVSPLRWIREWPTINEDNKILYGV